MGFFDLFKGGDKASGGKSGAGSKVKKEVSSNAVVAKWGDRAADKRAQNYDRGEALATLAEVGTSESAAALLKRFTFKIDPSITDQEEKDVAAHGVLAAGREAIEPIRKFSEKADSLAWPIKILKELVDETEYVEELMSWLTRWDTEYAKFIDPKIQLLVALEEHTHPDIRAAVEPFLDDVNETARFHAAAAIFHQDDETAVAALVRILPDEESFRVKNKISEGLIARGWVIPEDLREPTRKALPPGVTIDGEGKLKKH
ncbi:MAG: HEAT repeat domain-containing protein [Polyangiaceae bacterium]